MANVVLGIGTSHSPLLIMAGGEWELRSADDRRSRHLNTLDGRLVSYDELAAERGEPHREASDPARFPGLARQAEAALDHLAQALRDARPDVVVVVGDDQGELFGPDNMPAISIFRGRELLMKAGDRLRGPQWATAEFWRGYRMDRPHRYPGAPEMAVELIEGLIDEGVDVASVERVPDTGERGFGHAFGFVIERLLKDTDLPLLPILINTYYPPNAPTPRRCAEIGRKLRRAIDRSPRNDRIALIASGGLSHFLCEEAFDRQIVAALESKDFDRLAALQPSQLLAGSSEIRNWVAVANAIPDLPVDFAEYIPVYRTPAGTGIGLAFMCWK